MRRLDLTPLYKSSIGFDHLANVLDQLANIDTETGFPPYNIERLGETSIVFYGRCRLRRERSSSK